MVFKMDGDVFTSLWGEIIIYKFAISEFCKALYNLKRILNYQKITLYFFQAVCLILKAISQQHIRFHITWLKVVVADRQLSFCRRQMYL